MNGSISFDGTLTGGITGGGGGGGSTIVITPVVTEGTKIADVTVDGAEKDLYCPTVSPTEVTVTQVQESGTKIATIEVNGVSVDLYSPTETPTEVTVTQIQESGTKIATIGVDGVNTDIFAPAASGINYSTEEQLIGKYNNENLYQKMIHITEASEITSKTYTTEITSLNAKEIFCIGARVMLGSVENYKWVTTPYFNSVNYNTAFMLSTSDLVVISQGWNFKEIELIVQYTKNS